ncbi:acetolactate synthase-1/2/3 large subunit [Sporomusaceae bacterium BoRhaA]|uniref:thiamine pyrophosphate-binding protein n=1 Tax=Pelorhabdus rhamnosifermentans TaxID=2772457 RepID=UPI001C0637D7|nr:thiamine pyrophosphate-binding protein [Pelorhabdus rhamnosifermentans]MBU2699047.1 acetolactate synthase-1/2/3 large subunit [Pelorhabdus rhamnosifermentans]
MKLSDYVMKFLSDIEVKNIFGFQGGSIVHLIDSLYKNPKLVYVQNYHEQASAFSAEAYARITGNIGVALVSNGPGATNLVTGIANSYFDSVPCLYLAGQANTYAIKTNNDIRQQSFQETDIVTIVKSITKYAITIKDPSKIRFYLEKAVYLAKEGRPGPVLVDIPIDIQTANISEDTLYSFFDSEEFVKLQQKIKPINSQQVKETMQLLKESKCPLLLVGGGVRLADGMKLIQDFVSITGVPVVTSLMGLDAFPHDNPNFCGFLGSYGNRSANFAVANADFILVVGSRLDPRQTGGNVKLFATHAKIVHVDIDPNELMRAVPEAISIQSNLKEFFKVAISIVKENHYLYSAWIEQIEEWKNKYPSYPSQNDKGYIDPNEFLHILSQNLNHHAIICSDVGQNQMWVAQSCLLTIQQRLLNSGGLGSMGYSLPAGIGAYFADQDAQIICVMGDGGIQMNIQELQTIKKENIPAKIFIMNNHSLGMIRSVHEKYFNGACYGSVIDYSVPDFSKLAEAYGLEYTLIETKNDFSKLKTILCDKISRIIEVIISDSSQTYPEPTPGRALEDQSPLLDRDEFDRNIDVCVGRGVKSIY